MAAMWRLVTLLSVVAICALCQKSPELFTSMAAMKAMLKLLDSKQPNSMSKVVDKYVEVENERLEELRTVAADYVRNTNNLLKGNKVSDYIGHPVNAFVLIRQLHQDWAKIENIMQNTKADEFIQNMTTRPAGVPSDADVDGAATALMRLQDTYRLSAAQMASGDLGSGEKAMHPMSSVDTYFVGRSAYKNQDYYHCVDWMMETMNLIEKERNDKDVKITADEVDTLEHLGFSLYQQGNVERAMQITEKLMKLDPQHPRAKDNLKWYRDDMATNNIKYDPNRLPPLVNVRPADPNMPDSYEALCRGQNMLSPKTTSKFYCYYKRDRPFLKLAPFQVEIVHMNPMAVVFKNVISDAEIEVIKGLAMPKVANYGIGGHYEPHFDMSTRGERDPYEADIGNRIATVLFYLTVPRLGGATVFTSLKAAVFPEKNGALFWYNLYRNGEPDIRTRHAACPVLVGEKWVTNKWIHEGGQEFRRPCNTKVSEFFDETYVGQL